MGVRRHCQGASLWQCRPCLLSASLFSQTFHGTKKKERASNLQYVQEKGGVLLTTYGMLASNLDHLCKRGSSFTWDYLILDEGIACLPIAD